MRFSKKRSCRRWRTRFGQSAAKDLLIHRQALGILRNDVLEKLYPIHEKGVEN
jgi:hypothetical protein